MEEVYIIMPVIDIKENGKITRSLDGDVTCGSMAESTEDNGKTTLWTDMVTTAGKMAESTKGSIKKTKNTGTEFIRGQIIRNTQAGGIRVSNTVLESSSQKMANVKWVFGKTVKRSNGSTVTRLVVSLMAQLIIENSSRTRIKVKEG